MMRISIAGKRCERSARHAYDDGRHVLERIRHREEQYLHLSQPKEESPTVWNIARNVNMQSRLRQLFLIVSLLHAGTYTFATGHLEAANSIRRSRGRSTEDPSGRKVLQSSCGTAATGGDESLRFDSMRSVHLRREVPTRSSSPTAPPALNSYLSFPAAHELRLE